MRHSVAHLHSRLRHRTGDQTASVVAARFARLSKDVLAGALGRAFDEATDGTSVLVVGELRTHAVLRIHAAEPTPSDADLLSIWSRSVAQTAASLMARREGDNLIRFPSRAAFVAAFLRQLLAGRAWDQWWCGDFVHLRRTTVEDTAVACLADHADEIGVILNELGAEAASVLLARLDAHQCARVWRAALAAAGHTQAGPPAEGMLASAPALLEPDQLASLLTFIAAARDLAGRLAIPLRGESDRLVAKQLAERLGGPIDWRDPAALADAVATALAVLGAESCGPARTQPLPDAAAITNAIAALSWLDRTVLAARLRQMLAGAAFAPTPAPRLQKLLAEIARALAAGALPPHDSARTALALWSRFSAKDKSSAAEPMVRLWLDRIIGLVAALRAAGAGNRAAAVLRAGNIDSLRRQLAAAAPEWLATFDHVARVGESAVTVMATLAERLVPESPVLETQAAGILLLCRSLDDAGFDSACRDAGVHAPQNRQALRFALGRVIAGLDDAQASVDPALRLFAGLPLDGSPVDPADLPAPEVIAAVGRAVARTAALRRVWRPDRLVAWPLGSRTILADPSGFAWFVTDGVIGDDAFPAPVSPAVGASVNWVPASAALGLSGDDPVHVIIGGLAVLLLRVFAIWLRGFSASSISWLLTELVRRPGRLSLQPGAILIELEPRPYDAVLRSARYLEPYTWSVGGGARLSFALRESAA